MRVKLLYENEILRDTMECLLGISNGRHYSRMVSSKDDSGDTLPGFKPTSSLCDLRQLVNFPVPQCPHLWDKVCNDLSMSTVREKHVKSWEQRSTGVCFPSLRGIFSPTQGSSFRDLWRPSHSVHKNILFFCCLKFHGQWYLTLL